MLTSGLRLVVAVMLLLLIVKNEGLVDYYRWLAIVYGPFVVSELLVWVGDSVAFLILYLEKLVLKDRGGACLIKTWDVGTSMSGLESPTTDIN